ncbi:TonB-dependent receptor [Dyadobacter sp. Leaf189]|uniref:SusC/RagA family TonB-linked outer membrane protein n=1 Tax=Dyadobacter sp. Leaf189 TaxID=1736295 RepID=UPI0006F9B7AF|nr:TonB-dependent receptor [Dyadobacter sp. Leaf189]KQS34045.1 SusC/RagA family TonB-linked outer membrane protein [Dyadobacter sp. Leaf189]
MRQKTLLGFVMLLFGISPLMAQTREITGKVTDEAAKELPGVSIVIKGTQRGTATDANGLYKLTIPDQGPVTITFSFVGYQSQDVSPAGQSALDITMKPEDNALSEVVVVGYGTQRKKDLTGAISSIGSKEVAGRQTIQVSEALQGSIAGVSVTRSSGAPGAGSNILIRGITTIGTNNPLVIVDGVPVSSIDNVNPGDVENITVLKDAASAAIYGSRGAAGVILVTTKRAKNGQGSLEYTYEYGVQRATAMPEYVGVQDYMRYFNEQTTNDGASTGPFAQAFIDSYLENNRANPDEFPNTDWQRALITRKNAPRQRHDLVFTMGTAKIKTKASLGYSSSGAFYDNRSYDRYLFRVNNDLQVNDKIGVNLDVFYKRTNNRGNANELPNSDFNPIYESRIMPPIYDDVYSDGRLAFGKDGRNPLAKLRDGGFTRSLSNQIGGRISFNYKPVEGLTVTALVAPVFDLDKNKYFSKQIRYTNPDGTPSTIVNQARTVLTEGRSEAMSINGQLLANYVKEINGAHTIDILAGFEENYRSLEELTASRSGFALTSFPYLNSGSTELRDNSGRANESGLHSFFGRVQYNYKSKYFLQGNLRSDLSSRFAAAYRKAVYPSVSAGWTISEENFMKGSNWLSFLKLRGSWGEAGNERLLDKDNNPAYYPYLATIDFSTALFYQNGSVVPLTGGGQQVYAVENISWETSRTLDFGLDAAFLNDRLTIAADYYRKTTTDILLPLDIPLYLGFDKPNQNAGTLKVQGWELEAAWRDRIGKIGYSVAANLSDAKSTVGDLKGTEFRGDQIIRNGSEYNEWFGYLSNGLFQTPDEITGAPVLNVTTKPGDVRYVDVNKDGKITTDDKVLLGGALPRYLYGGNLRADYGGFDFGVSFQGVAKKLSRLNSDAVQPFAEAFGNMPTEMVGKFWSANNSPEQNLRATYPRLSRTSNAANYTLSDYWLINGGYFRVKNITLGYTLPQDLIKKAGVQSLRLYMSANDVFSLSKFPKYLDPESASYSYPIVTTLMAGATIRF